jgi:hypothetical protein
LLNEAAAAGRKNVVDADPHRHGTALGWAFPGADYVKEATGQYPETVRSLLDAGAAVRKDQHVPNDPTIRGMIDMS